MRNKLQVSNVLKRILKKKKKGYKRDHSNSDVFLKHKLLSKYTVLVRKRFRGN